MAVEDADEERRWGTSLQARAEKEKAASKKRSTKKNIKRQQERLTKTSPKSEVGKGQREVEMLKSRTAGKVQCLRIAGSGKWAPEGDEVWSLIFSLHIQ
jgi:hypothetical protein